MTFLQASARQVLQRTACRTSLRQLNTSAPRFAILGEGTKEEFQKHVVEGQKVTIVDFHADWCPPCKMLDPILSKVMQNEDQVDYMKINTDNEQEIAQKYKVQALPTVIAFKHGKEYSRFVGFVDENAVKNFVANVKE